MKPLRQATEEGFFSTDGQSRSRCHTYGPLTTQDDNVFITNGESMSVQLEESRNCIGYKQPATRHMKCVFSVAEKQSTS